MQIEWLQSIKDNPIVVGALGGGIIWSVISHVKTLFQYIYSIFAFFFSRDITCRENEIFYVNFLTFLSSRIKSPRTLRIVKENDSLKIVLGKGKHRLFFMNSYIVISVVEEIKAGTDKPIEYATITVWSLFVHSKIEQIKNEFLKTVPEATEKSVFKFDPQINSMAKVGKAKPRNIKSVFIDENVKSKLISIIDQYENSEYHKKLSINKKIGIMLYGPPGTGKSSLAKAIASYMDRDIFYLPPDPKSIKSAIMDLHYFPSKKVIIIDDIDCLSSSFTNRKAKGNVGDIKIGEMLEFLDGNDYDDCVVIATTNNYNDLDPAIVRAGRFDVKVEIKPATREIAEKMVDFVDPSKRYILDTFTYPVPQANIQAKLISNEEIVL